MLEPDRRVGMAALGLMQVVPDGQPGGGMLVWRWCPAAPPPLSSSAGSPPVWGGRFARGA